MKRPTSLTRPTLICLAAARVRRLGRRRSGRAVVAVIVVAAAREPEREQRAREQGREPVSPSHGIPLVPSCPARCYPRKRRRAGTWPALSEQLSLSRLELLRRLDLAGDDLRPEARSSGVTKAFGTRASILPIPTPLFFRLNIASVPPLNLPSLTDLRRQEDRLVDPLDRAGHDVASERLLVAVDADAPDVLLPWRRRERRGRSRLRPGRRPVEPCAIWFSAISLHLSCATKSCE